MGETVGAATDKVGSARRTLRFVPTPTLPASDQRWRCTRCGNLTRFDVTRTTRRVEFWHFDLPGAAQVESTEVLEETVERVRCRWCESVSDVELVARTDVSAAASPGADAGDVTGGSDSSVAG